MSGILSFLCGQALPRCLRAYLNISLNTYLSNRDDLKKVGIFASYAECDLGSASIFGGPG